MWYFLRASPAGDGDFGSSATELLQSTSRTFVLCLGGIYFAWHVAATVAHPATLGPPVWYTTFVVAPALILTLLLLPRRLVAALVICQIGLAAAITLSLYLFQQPAIAFLYVILIHLSAAVLGWPAGIFSLGTVTALLWWIARTPAMPAMSDFHIATVVVVGALTGVLGWAAARSLLTLTEWSLHGLQRAREKMVEALERQIELKQTQEDLQLANRELARLSERLKAMHAIAEEARRAKEEFAANVSHELRTPLNMVIGFSETIIQSPHVYGSSLSPKLMADVSAIRRNSLHLARLVNDILDLSQVDAGRMALSREWVHISDIVEEAIAALQPLFESKGLYLNKDIPPDLAPVFCDGTRISQVMTNLLSNAGRYTEQGGVHVRAYQHRNEVVISVSDTGPGIAPEHQRRLFEPFERLDGATRYGQRGTGLGLSISKRFVEMHGGRIWLESSVGAGATFYFSLPIEPPPLSAAIGAPHYTRGFAPDYEYRARSRPSKAPAQTVAPRYVLLEGGKTLQALFARYAEGIEIAPVRSVEEAVCELARSPAQALVVNMPHCGSANATADRLADVPLQTPVVTCYVPGRDEAARRLGVIRYLVKPISREVLLSTLGELGPVESILVVDDEPEMLQLLTRLLASTECSRTRRFCGTAQEQGVESTANLAPEQRRYRIVRARTGWRALELLRQRRVDVMLLDLIMPGMDGFRVLEQKSQDPSIRDIPVVVISSRDPMNEPIVSNMLTITRSGGLSVPDLLSCIQAVSRSLSPEVRSACPGPPEGSAA
ncbi:MAG: ATP-binding protein [Anaerolineae bacterium]